MTATRVRVAPPPVPELINNDAYYFGNASASLLLAKASMSKISSSSIKAVEMDAKASPVIRSLIHVENWRLRLNCAPIKLFRWNNFGNKMRTIKSKDFTAKTAWEAINIANMNGVTTRLHWTDKPYQWHVNDGEEVFAVLDGAVEMHYRENGEEKRIRLETGDIFFAEPGCEHVAHPIGEARILVVEKEGSV